MRTGVPNNPLGECISKWHFLFFQFLPSNA